jgi:alpha-L-rhamnosidase
MFSAVGMEAQSIFAGALFDEIREDARKALILPDGVTIIGRSQTAQAMAIEFGLLEDAEKQGAFNVLLDLIHTADDHLDSGCLGARIILHTLAKFGYAELAYKMITRTDYPSYGHWVEKENATSLFEDFRHPDDKPASKNHHFFGDISSWFFKYVAGVKINPFDRGVNEIEISPNFIQSLEYAEGYQNHLGGKIESKWVREDKLIKLTVTIPEGCYGFLNLPKGYSLHDESRAPIYRYANKPLVSGTTSLYVVYLD